MLSTIEFEIMVSDLRIDGIVVLRMRDFAVLISSHLNYLQFVTKTGLDCGSEM